jgi:phytol kinase
MLNNNWLALLITFLVALAWLRINDFAAHRGWMTAHLSRKIIHMGTGPLYVACWLLFTPSPSSRYMAALVPLLFTVQFILIGTGIVIDESSVQAMSRSGDRREILRGPVFYGVVFVVLTLVYWTTSPIGMTALMLMCGGDGLADILGRRFGVVKLPWTREKSWIGSLGMLIGGWVFALAILAIYVSAKVFPAPLGGYLSAVTWVAVIGTLVESLPFRDIDNITVTVAAALVGHLTF